MIVSWKWLADYVRLDTTPDEFARRMMLAGFNHESTVAVGSDYAVDLEITSNRPDCLGHIGLAREAAVLWNTPLNIPAAAPCPGATAARTLIDVEVAEPALCPQYSARIIRGVKVGPSPSWLIERLATLGIATVNNIVDVTNYVLMECGQPLHAFDYAKLQGKRIVVRNARTGEKIEAINHKTYELTPRTLVIADANRPIAIAGVMGGADTEVTNTTIDVLIESARFDPLCIRTTARALALKSDSSYRFERGLDPQGVDWASRRCCELILQIAGGELATGMVMVETHAEPVVPVTLRFEQLTRVIGIPYPPERVEQILTALGMKLVDKSPFELTVTPPSWRRDLTREIDLIEETARIYGYDAIPEDRAVPLVPSARTHHDRVADKIRRRLTGAGWDEVLTLSAVDAEADAAFSPWTDKPALQTSVPVLRRADYLRRSLLPSLLQIRRTNESVNNPRIEIFETAKIYLANPSGLPTEIVLLGLCSGEDFFAVKGVIEQLIAELQPTAQLSCEPHNDSFFATGQGVRLLLNGKILGYLGQVCPQVAAKFELRGPTVTAELRLDALENIAVLIPQVRELSPFPSVTRDINLVVDESVRWAAVEQTVRLRAGEELESLAWRDTYRDEKRLGTGKKSLLFSLLLRGRNETLTGERVEEICERVIQACIAEHNGVLRA